MKFLNESGYSKWNARPKRITRQRTINGVKYVAVRTQRATYVRVEGRKYYYHTHDLDLAIKEAIEGRKRNMVPPIRSLSHDDRDLLRDPDVDFSAVKKAVLQALAGRECKCASCGKQQPEIRVDLYDHEYGVELVEALPKQWVSLHCPLCNYDTSLNKLRIAK